MSSVNTTQTSMTELSGCSCQRSVHWSQMAEKEKGRERQMTEMAKKEGGKKRAGWKTGWFGVPLAFSTKLGTQTTHTQKYTHTQMLKHYAQIQSNCWLWFNINMVQSIATCGMMEKDLLTCQLSSSVVKLVWGTREYNQQHPTVPANSSLFLFFCGSGVRRGQACMVTRATCDPLRNPHLTELSHQGHFIRRSACLLFLLLTACVFILRMPGFSAHSCFSSTLMFS